MGLFSGDDSGFNDARNAITKNRLLYEGLDMPVYEDWNPEMLESDSAEYQLTSDDPLARSAQLSALSKMAGLADEGLSDADQAGYTKAVNSANQVAKGNTGAIMQNAQARGVGGSGLEMLMREQAGQDAATRAQDAGMQVAGDAAKQRALYNQAFMTGTSQMRDQDYNTNKNNSSIINQFNQANTQARNQVAQGNVGLKNEAFQYNQGLKDKNYQNQIGQVDRIAGLNNRDGEISAAEAEQKRKKNAAIGGVVGGVAGGMIGGPAGAQAGAGIGQAIY